MNLGFRRGHALGLLALLLLLPLLVVLVCVGVPLKYLNDDSRVVTWTGMPHGWLYMIFLFSAFLLSRRARWDFPFTLVTLVCGTIPLVSFWAEHRATRRVRAEHPELA